MRFSKIDLQCEDIVWFGVDKNECIFACTSGGMGNVPEFVCKSKEETERLRIFFTDLLPTKTEGRLLIHEENTLLCQDGMKLAKKGLYCFDVSDDGDAYVKISEPRVPLKIFELPQKIQKLMNKHFVNINAGERNIFSVEHAY